MAKNRPPRKPYRQRLINIPVMPELVGHFEMQLRTSLAVLRTSPVIEAFDAIAECLDVIGITLNNLKRPDLHQSFVIIQSGASAMIQIKGKYERTGKTHMTDVEYLPILNAVNESIEVLPRVGVTDLYVAMQKVKLSIKIERVVRAANRKMKEE